MIRTQISLTEEQNDKLSRIARSKGQKRSAIIRQAIDNLIAIDESDHKELILRQAAGIWKNHTDLPDFRATRSERDR